MARGDVGERFGPVRIRDLSPDSDYSRASQLKGILARPAYSSSFDQTLGPRNQHLGVRETSRARLPHSQRAIGHLLRVDQHGERDLEPVAKGGRFRDRSHPDDADSGLLRLEVGVPVAQLRDLLAAKGSAVMPKPYHHGRLLRPHTCQTNGAVERVFQHHIVQLCYAHLAILDVVVKIELPGVRPQPELIDLVHALVVDPMADDIVGEHSSFQEEVMVGLERVQCGI